MNTTSMTRTTITELTISSAMGHELRIKYIAGDIKIEIGAESFWCEAEDVDSLIEAIKTVQEAGD